MKQRVERTWAEHCEAFEERRNKERTSPMTVDPDGRGVSYTLAGTSRTPVTFNSIEGFEGCKLLVNCEYRGILELGMTVQMVLGKPNLINIREPN